MNKKAIAGIGLVSLGAVVLSMGKREQVKRDLLEPKTPDLTRQTILQIAETQLGPQDPKKYWLDVIPEHPGFSGAWCGGFTLWVLHEAGIAKDIQWEMGKGYCYRLPTTNNPQPGDIAYFDKPYQHHAFVERIEGNSLYTIDGNQPGNTVAKRLRPRDSVTAFYSIEPLLSAKLTA